MKNREKSSRTPKRILPVKYITQSSIHVKKKCRLEGLIPATVPGIDHDGGGIPPTGIGTSFFIECFAGLYDISSTAYRYKPRPIGPPPPLLENRGRGHQLASQLHQKPNPWHHRQHAISGFLASYHAWDSCRSPRTRKNRHSDDDASPASRVKRLPFQRDLS